MASIGEIIGVGLGSPDWAVRRRMMVVCLLFCGGYATVALFWVESDSRAETAISQAFTAAMAIITTYVLGAVWDDKGKHPTKTKTEVQKVTETDEGTKVETTTTSQTTRGIGPVAPVKPVAVGAVGPGETVELSAPVTVVIAADDAKKGA